MSLSTLNQFAWQLGAHARITLEHSTTWHKAYTKADPATQSAWRKDFIVNFVMGNLDVTSAKAEAIIAMKRTERTQKQELAVNAAGQKFRYHISRDGAKSRTEPAKGVRVSAAERAAFAALFAACGEDSKRLKAVLKALV